MEEILSLAAALSASLGGGSPYPSIDPDKPFLGYYYTVEEVEEGGEELYGIPALMADDFRAMGREVRTQPDYNQHLGFFLRYSSKATPELGKVTGIRPVYASLDSLIFLIGELEKEADRQAFEATLNLDPETGQPTYTGLDSELKKRNAVLGYLRATNSKYTSGDLLDLVNYVFNENDQPYFFDLVCGSTNGAFDQRIRNSVRHLFRYQDFFARFVSESVYNVQECGNPTFVLGQEESWKLPIYDPIEPSVSLHSDSGTVTVHPELDLPHLFAVIDGNMPNTGSALPIFRLPDIVSWAGDLQTLYEYNYQWITYNDNPRLIFEKTMSLPDTRFGVDDLISDVDGVNIGERYMGYLNKRLSEALATYYSPKPNFSHFRYDQFPANATPDEAVYPGEGPWDRFERKAYWDMRLQQAGNGEYEDIPYQSMPPELRHYLIKDDPSSNANIRKKLTEGFLSFLLNKTNFGTGSC